MKVSILTWIRALNHGAVLQAYASQEILKKLGVEVEFLEYTRRVESKQSIKTKIIRRINQIKTMDFLYSKKYKEFNKSKKIIFNTSVSDLLNIGNDCKNAKCECLMIGSDMVFNLLQGYTPQVFGNQIDAAYIFSYAACSGGSTFEVANKLGLVNELKQGLNLFKGLSCRDKITIEFVKNITGRADETLNIDPVLLYGFTEEQNEWDTGKWKEHAPYIMIYAYHSNLNAKAEIREIQAYAKRNRYQIVSCGYYHPWCNININADPKEFLEMIKNAQAIVTDTFHGSVFSLICEKRFCAIVRGNGYKLRELLIESGMESQIACQNNDITKILSNDNIQYDNFNKWLKNEQILSLEYIKEQLTGAKRANDGE